MYYVYYLKSLKYPEQSYIGYTQNLKQRLLVHNAGKSLHTSKYKPWKLVSFVGFETKYKALSFEKYLKTNAGRLFIKRRLL